MDQGMSCPECTYNMLPPSLKEYTDAFMEIEKKEDVNAAFSLRNGLIRRYRDYFNTGYEPVEYIVEFKEKPFDSGLDCATGNKRGAIVNTLTPDLESSVLVGSVIISINGKPCGKHTYKSILRKLDEATLPCKIGLLYQPPVDDEKEEESLNNNSTNGDKNNTNNKHNTCSTNSGKQQDVKYSLCSLYDDLISEISEYFNFYDFTMCFSILCQRIYDVSYLNKRNIKQLHIDYIVSFLYQWIPHVDDEARKQLSQIETATAAATATASTQNEVDIYNILKNTQNVVLKDGFFLKYKSKQDIYNSFIHFSNNIVSICDDICQNIVALSDVDKISQDYAEYHNGTKDNSNSWDSSAGLKLIPPLCWTKRSYGRSIHVNCCKKTKHKLMNLFVYSNCFNILSLLNFVLNCEKSQLYSNHILVAIILKSLFKFQCHSLARYIIYLIDKHFDLITVEEKIFDVNIQYGFWSCSNDDLNSGKLNVNTTPFIVYNISSNMQDKAELKDKIVFAKEDRIKLEEKIPDNLESQYELHRQWCQYIKYDWYIPGEAFESNVSCFKYYNIEYWTYIRDLIYIQVFGGDNVSKKHKISVENRRKFFCYADCEKVDANRVDSGSLMLLLGPLVPIVRDVDYYPKWLSQVC